jgi:hypothetical protein
MRKPLTGWMMNKTEWMYKYHLEELVKALDNAFISSWQSTAAWQQQLEAAKEFLAHKAKTE